MHAENARKSLAANDYAHYAWRKPMHAEDMRKSLPANDYAPYARPKVAYARGGT
jgi:hypothetical protein